MTTGERVIERVIFRDEWERRAIAAVIDAEIALAVVAAKEAERERCARVAESSPECGCGPKGWPCDRCIGARNIAQTIRAGIPHTPENPTEVS